VEGLAGFWAGRRPEQCQRPRADSGLGSGTETLQFHKVQANCSEKSVIKKKKVLIVWIYHGLQKENCTKPCLGESS